MRKQMPLEERKEERKLRKLVPEIEKKRHDVQRKGAMMNGMKGREPFARQRAKGRQASEIENTKSVMRASGWGV